MDGQADDTQVNTTAPVVDTTQQTAPQQVSSLAPQPNDQTESASNQFAVATEPVVVVNPVDATIAPMPTIPDPTPVQAQPSADIDPQPLATVLPTGDSPAETVDPVSPAPVVSSAVPSFSPTPVEVSAVNVTEPAVTPMGAPTAVPVETSIPQTASPSDTPTE